MLRSVVEPIRFYDNNTSESTIGKVKFQFVTVEQGIHEWIVPFVDVILCFSSGYLVTGVGYCLKLLV